MRARPVRSCSSSVGLGVSQRSADRRPGVAVGGHGLRAGSSAARAFSNCRPRWWRCCSSSWRVRPSRGWPSSRRAAVIGACEVAAARGVAGAQRDTRPGQLSRAAHGRAHGPRHPRDRRARRLLLAVPATALPRRDRAGRRARRGGSQDWISAAIIVVTLPLIPLFMVLVGASTRARVDRQFRVLQRLAGHFLDVVAGLPTLKVFGRAHAQVAAIGAITDRYRSAALATLRVAFLSSLLLELVASVAVALVAVEVGLRLMGGDLGPQTALFVLVLAPEAYLPLRLLGQIPRQRRGHGGRAAGVCAARPAAARAQARARRRPARRPDAAQRALGQRSRSRAPRVSGRCSKGCRSAYGPASARRDRPERVREIDAARRAARLRRGPPAGVRFGGGRARRARSGRLACTARVGTATAALVRRPRWRDTPRRRPAASREEIWEAVGAAGLLDVVARLPDGLDAPLGDRGAGLSAGERQRVAPRARSRGRARAVARRAHRQPRRSHRGGRAREQCASCSRPRTAILGGAPPGAARDRRPVSALGPVEALV